MLSKLFAGLKSQRPILFDAVKVLLENGNGLRVKQVATDFNLSVRHFQRQVKYFTGFTPHQLLKISRFQTAIKQKHFHSLTDLAFLLGYYDQSHFINDFKKCTGITPKEYFIKKSPDLQWSSSGKEVAFFQF